MKFDRALLQGLIDASASSVEVTLSATTTDGSVLVGKDTLRVIR